mgnify:CR=1 FL=1
MARKKKPIQHLGSNGSDVALRGFVERIERLEEEKFTLLEDIASIYTEAKHDGFDIVTMRHVIRLRKTEKTERDEKLALLDEYMRTLGMLADTPLGQAAARQLFGKSRIDFEKEEKAEAND